MTWKILIILFRKKKLNMKWQTIVWWTYRFTLWVNLRKTLNNMHDRTDPTKNILFERLFVV